MLSNGKQKSNEQQKHVKRKFEWKAGIIGIFHEPLTMSDFTDIASEIRPQMLMYAAKHAWVAEALFIQQYTVPGTLYIPLWIA